MRSISKLILPLMLCIFISPVSALQSEYIENRQSGVGVVSSFHYRDGVPKVVIEPSYSIDGYVDIGLSLEMEWGEDLLDSPSRETDATVSLGFSVLKQDRIMPVSLLLQMGMHYLSETSDEYVDNDIISSGTGFSAGAKVFRYIPLAQRCYGRLGLEANQRMDTIIIEELDGSALLPLSATRNVFTYGVFVGVTIRPDRPNKGVAVSGDLGFYRNSEGENRISGSVVLTFVENLF